MDAVVGLYGVGKGVRGGERRGVADVLSLTGLWHYGME